MLPNPSSDTPLGPGTSSIGMLDGAVIRAQARAFTYELQRLLWGQIYPVGASGTRVRHRSVTCRRAVGGLSPPTDVSADSRNALRDARTRAVLSLLQFPQVKGQNLYTRLLLRFRAYLAARLSQASAQW
jgi:hypothetical protein